MAENINEALGVSTSNAPAANQKQDDNSAENTLSIIATVVLISGLIASFVCLITLTSIEVGYHKEFNPVGLGYTIMVLMSTLISWSVMKVLSNISLTLKDLNNKIKGELQGSASKPHSTSKVEPVGVSKEQRIADLKTLVETGALSQEEFDELTQE